MQNPDKIITIPFASQGDKTEVGNTPNPNVINYPQGYSQNFELPLGAGGQAIQRPGLNGLLYDITNILKYLQFGNKPTFDSRIAAAGGYPLGAVLTYYPDNSNPQNAYEVVSSKANNTDDFVTTPSFIGTSWLPYNQGISMSGSNTNGFYFRFNNGMQICIKSHVTLNRQDVGYSIGSWTYPQSFVGGEPIVLAQPMAGAGNFASNILTCLAVGNGLNSCSIRSYTRFSGYDEYVTRAHIIAIGPYRNLSTPA